METAILVDKWYQKMQNIHKTGYFRGFSDPADLF